MAKKKPKAKKKRAKKYEVKLSINASFKDVIKVALKDADKKK